MKNLKKKVGDFTVNNNGEAFISQRKLSDLTGVPQKTISNWIRKDGSPYIVNENNQLDAKSLGKLVKVAHSKGYPQCSDLLDKLLEAGATAFIYYNAERVTPEQLKIAKLQEDLKIEQSKVKIVGVGSPLNRKSLHDQREDLFEKGFCEKNSKSVKHYFYPCTDLGNDQGYTDLNEGTNTATINLNK